MRAVVLGRDGATALHDVPVPRPRDGEVLVRVTAVGLCGSDVEKLADGTGIEGSVLGHELAGVVEAGALPPGTRVALAHRVPCGVCADCLARPRDLLPAVPRLRASGRAASRSGWWRPPATSARSCCRCPTTSPTSPRTFVEPLGCIVRGARASCRAAPCLVAGCGAVGRLAARRPHGPRRRRAGARRRPGPAAGRGRGRASAGRPRTSRSTTAVVTAPAALDATLALPPSRRHRASCSRLQRAAAGAARPIYRQRAGRRRLALGHAGLAAGGARR